MWCSTLFYGFRKIPHWDVSSKNCNLQPNWRPRDFWLDSWTLGNSQKINYCQRFVCVCVCVCVRLPRGKGRQQCAAPEFKTPLGLEEPQGPFSSQPFFSPQGSCPDALIAGRLPEETHGLFKHNQTLDWTLSLPGEHFLYPHVTCHKICLTHTATDSRSQPGSAITGDSINSPAAT